MYHVPLFNKTLPLYDGSPHKRPRLSTDALSKCEVHESIKQKT